ncbi:MAG: iron-sulfur cluster repair di-iron protein [Planctomycetota bacterium]|jgi:regulator of cell morphogenesis and NO signaling
MASATSESTLADLVTERPGRSRVFENLGLDYCCNGGQSLASACQKSGKDLDAVLAQLTAFDAAAGDSDEPDFGDMGLGELVDHIVKTHHAYLKEEMQPLSQLIEKVTRVHGRTFPWLIQMRRLTLEMFMELDAHLQKEEMVLFPMMRELETATSAPAFHCGTVGAPISVMEMEHDAAGEHLAQLREITSGFAVPEDGCNSFRAMMNRMEALEYDLHRHIHKENSLLHPMALALSENLGC